MNLTIAKKALRFIELSEKFRKTETELFGESFTQYATLSFHTVDVGSYRAPTRTEKIKTEAASRIQMSEEFDEYVQHSKELQKYFQAGVYLNE